MFLREPYRLFFRMNLALSLRLGDQIQQLAYYWPRLQLEAAYQLFGADQAGREDAVAFADVACEQQAYYSQVSLPRIVCRLGTEGCQVVGQRKQSNIDACWPKVDKVAPDCAWCHWPILSQLTWAHVVGCN